MFIEGFILLILLLYLLLMLWLYRGIDRVPEFRTRDKEAITGFSVIIAFRNEAANLDILLQSLLNINYPKDLFEILLVNDSSTDDSVKKIKAFINKNSIDNFFVLESIRKTVSPKKDAINTAITTSKYEWIVTTDADCEVPDTWLQTFNSFISTSKAVFIAAPVLYKEKKGFIHQFQALDWLSLVGTTIGSFGQKKPLMCSGANLLYSKDVFNEVSGFTGNEHIASGDDVFIMQKINKKYPEKSFFLNAISARVYTQSLSGLTELFQQRVRWAMKTGSLSNRFVQLTGILVLAINLVLVSVPILILFDKSWCFLASIIVIKLGIDCLFLKKTAGIVKQKITNINGLLSSLFYPVFTLSVIVLGLFGKFNWKGRYFSK
jgi:cellulose synthase/poly-beta-1,6-N-acetylglucosamine synthase-like glycosyltransferase